jgi:hypothetical protein
MSQDHPCPYGDESLARNRYQSQKYTTHTGVILVIVSAMKGNPLVLFIGERKVDM